MFRRFAAVPFAVAVICTGALPALAQGYDDSDFVPVEEMARIFAEHPYECAEYRQEFDDCSALSIYEDLGDGDWSTSSLFLFEEAPSPTFAGRMELTAEDGRLCGDMTDIELAAPEVPRDMVATIQEALRTELAQYGRVCMAFYALGGGDYMTVLRDEDGAIMPQGEVEVTFVDGEKPLYFVQETDI